MKGVDFPEIELRILGNFEELSSPTSGTFAPGDTRGLYVTEQFSGVWRIDLDRPEKRTWVVDLSKVSEDMRRQASHQGWKKEGFRHWKSEDFAKGLSDERGVLGLAFHPRFEDNRLFYVFYSLPSPQEDLDHLSVVGEFVFPTRLSRPLTEQDQRREILRFTHTVFNHNGGTLAFGPQDGFLYLSMGDGGDRDDAHGNLLEEIAEEQEASLKEKGPGAFSYLGNAQDPTNLYGKILRIDVDQKEFSEKSLSRFEIPIEIGNSKNIPSGIPRDSFRYPEGTLEVPYQIPPDNPFVGKTVDDFPPAIASAFSSNRIREEIYAYGLRNPWKFSFDENGRLFAGDVGQDLVEEVDLLESGGNYGWRVMEGDRVFHRPMKKYWDREGLGDFLLPPILTYGRDPRKTISGFSVIGGYVYSGSSIPSLRVVPTYIFGDYLDAEGQGKILYAQETSEGWRGKGHSRGEPGVLFYLPQHRVHSLAQDAEGEIYVLMKNFTDLPKLKFWNEKEVSSKILSDPQRPKFILGKLEYSGKKSRALSQKKDPAMSEKIPRFEALRTRRSRSPRREIMERFEEEREEEALEEALDRTLERPSFVEEEEEIEEEEAVPSAEVLPVERYVRFREKEEIIEPREVPVFRMERKEEEISLEIPEAEIPVPIEKVPLSIQGEGQKFTPLFVCPALEPEEANEILNRAGKYARETAVSDFRRKGGQPTFPRMHLAVLSRNGQLYTRSMEDAWKGSFELAVGKAYTALAFSSNENALTSRSVGLLSQPGGPLWQIGTSSSGKLVEFPGGVPLYASREGGIVLVGAFGVSGDSVGKDEEVAYAGAEGYEAPTEIRVDTVTSPRGRRRKRSVKISY